jgi:hypothetical protein
VALVTVLVGLSACGRYDANLLGSEVSCGDGQLGLGELCDTAITAGEPGACPARCDPNPDPCMRSVLSGSACGAHCAPSPVTLPLDGDGCCLEGLAGDDADCSVCGDAIVGAGEQCDPPESCVTPEQCTSSSECVEAVYLGSPETCDASCELRMLAGCREAGDGCGDGIASADAGETCDPASESSACPERCDDGDPCTLSMLMGSAAACTAECVHTPIERFVNGDGCCPSSARAGDDSDCGACGSADAGEDCPSSVTGAAAVTCLDRQVRAGELSPACADCACQRCAASSLACFSSGDAARDVDCSAAALCIDRARCRGDQCFCGADASCEVPAGPCRSELATAAGAADLETIGRCASDPECALYWSAQYIACTLRECASACAR